MISIVTWLWSGNRAYKPEHVNTLARMVARHLPEPHRFICVADNAEGFSAGVEVFPTPPEARELGRLCTPEGARFPSCYRRLWMFSEAAKALGERVLLIDIDLVVVSDLRPLFERTEPFVGWRPYRDWGRKCRFGGGIYLMTPGARTEVYTKFKGARSILEARAAGFRGSDQAWISHCLGDREPYFDREAGIYSIRDFRGADKVLPDDAVIVQLNGPMKPWSPEARRLDWITNNFV